MKAIKVKDLKPGDVFRFHDDDSTIFIVQISNLYGVARVMSIRALNTSNGKLVTCAIMSEVDVFILE